MLAVVIENPSHLVIFQMTSASFLAILGTATIYWLYALLPLVGIALAFAFLIATGRRRNPLLGLRDVLTGFVQGVIELATLPLGYRRIWAVARLSFKEAIRRRILYVFLLFMIPFLFAGWYLPNREDGQIIFLVAFSDGMMTYLLLPLAVFLVSMSLPNDLRQQTIHTIVTKPIRRSEWLVGRLVGYMGIFTLVLIAMGTISLIYIRNQTTESVREKQWTARVPIFATEVHEPAYSDFRVIGNFPEAEPDAQGRMPENRCPPFLFVKDGIYSQTGIHVGKMWEYRSHVGGQDFARWFFVFDPEKFRPFIEADVPVRAEFTFNIFKTNKGDPYREGAEQSGIFAKLRIVDPISGRQQEPTVRVEDHRITAIDLRPELFENGRLMVDAKCINPNQYLGMAAADFYFLAAERPFEANYFKGLVTLWLKVLLLVTVALAASTVLNGFVAVLMATAIYLMGLNYGFLRQVVAGDVEGGGPLRSLLRMVTIDKTGETDQTLLGRIAGGIDGYVRLVLNAVSRIIPDLSSLDTAYLVASGVDVPWLLLAVNAAIVFGYVIPVMILGCFLFRGREVAA